MRAIVFAVAAALTLTTAPAVAQAAQEPGTGVPAVESPAADALAQAPPAASSQLPVRSPPPATLRAYWHLFLAYAITVLLIFGYALTVGRRFARLEDEVRRMSG